MIETSELLTAPVVEPVAPKFTPSLTMPEAVEMAALFNALRHPVRLRVLGLLAKYEGSICVYEIADALGMSQPTISHHLANLQACGLVTAYCHGLYTYHEINHDVFARVPAMIAKLTGQEV